MQIKKILLILSVFILASCEEPEIVKDFVGKWPVSYNEEIGAVLYENKMFNCGKYDERTKSTDFTYIGSEKHEDKYLVLCKTSLIGNTVFVVDTSNKTLIKASDYKN